MYINLQIKKLHFKIYKLHRPICQGFLNELSGLDSMYLVIILKTANQYKQKKNKKLNSYFKLYYRKFTYKSLKKIGPANTFTASLCYCTYLISLVLLINIYFLPILNKFKKTIEI